MNLYLYIICIYKLINYNLYIYINEFGRNDIYDYGAYMSSCICVALVISDTVLY